VARLQKALALQKQEVADLQQIAERQQERLSLEEARSLKAEAAEWKLRAQVEQLTVGRLSREVQLNKQLEDKKARIIAEVNSKKEDWERAAFFRGLAEGRSQAQPVPAYSVPPTFQATPARVPPASGAALRIANKRRKKG